MLVVPKDQHECKITNKCQRFTPPRPSENSILRILDFQIISCTAWI